MAIGQPSPEPFAESYSLYRVTRSSLRNTLSAQDLKGTYINLSKSLSLGLR